MTSARRWSVGFSIFPRSGFAGIQSFLAQ